MAQTVGVVGLGTMGAGIAQVCLEAGHAVIGLDGSAEARERGLERVRTGLEKRVAKEQMTADACAAALERLTTAEEVAGLVDGIDEEDRIAAAEAGEIADVRQRGDEEAVDPGLPQALAKPAPACAHVEDRACRASRYESTPKPEIVPVASGPGDPICVVVTPSKRPPETLNLFPVVT